MAANIYDDDTMAYRESGGLTWHGLGTRVGDETPDHVFFSLAGLDWRTVEMPVLVRGKHEDRVALDFKALVRSRDGRVLSVVGKDYQVVQNDQVWEFFRKFCDRGEIRLESAGSLYHGTKIWALGKLQGAGFTLGNNGAGDRTNGYVLFSTGHKCGFATQAEITAVRVVCDNTLSMARTQSSDYRFKLSHSGRWNESRIGDARKVVEDGIAAMRSYHEQADRLYHTPASPVVQTAYLIELLQPAILDSIVAGDSFTIHELAKQHQSVVGAGVLDAILDAGDTQTHLDTGKRVLDVLTDYIDQGKLPYSRSVQKVHDLLRGQMGETTDTMWNGLNAVTYYVDHVRGRGPASAIDSALFGQGAILKADALKLAVDYADRIGEI